MCHRIAICFYDSPHSAALWDRCAGAEFECWSVVTVSQCSDSLPGSQTRWAAVPPTIPNHTLLYPTIHYHTQPYSVRLPLCGNDTICVKSHNTCIHSTRCVALLTKLSYDHTSNLSQPSQPRKQKYEIAHSV